MIQRDWKPVKRGGSYCAPACGRGCTLAEFREATKRAKELVTRLSASVPEGKWTPRVWENLGWHCSVSNKTLRIDLHTRNTRDFSAFLQISGPWGGNLVEHGGSPEVAIKNALKTAKTQLKPLISTYVRLAQ